VPGQLLILLGDLVVKKVQKKHSRISKKKETHMTSSSKDKENDVVVHHGKPPHEAEAASDTPKVATADDLRALGGATNVLDAIAYRQAYIAGKQVLELRPPEQTFLAELYQLASAPANKGE